MNRENIELFKNKIIDHIINPSTIVREGTYLDNVDVLQYFNPDTCVNVMIRADANTF